MGARTHLIMPVIHSAASQTAAPVGVAEDHEDAVQLGGGSGAGGGGGSGGGGGGVVPPAIPKASSAQLADVKAQYVSTLIKLFETKSAQGELDEKLMERIERLLEGK
jgi:hypothetical protein